MANLNPRGAKRICQSASCALPFYDLNRTDISCPNCGTVFDSDVGTYTRALPSSAPSWKRGGRSFQRAAAAPVAEPAELPDVETADDNDDGAGADAGELILEDDADEEIVDVLKPPADDRTDV